MARRDTPGCGAAKETRTQQDACNQIGDAQQSATQKCAAEDEKTIVGSTQNPQNVRNDQADKADDAGESRGDRYHEHVDGEYHPPQAPDVDSERHRFVVADHERVEGLCKEDRGHESEDRGQAHHEDRIPVRARERSQVPVDDGASGRIAGHIRQKSNTTHEERVDRQSGKQKAQNRTPAFALRMRQREDQIG
jgi:hypothetical protein